MTVEQRIKQLEEMVAKIAPALDEVLNPTAPPRTVGFLICVFDFGDKGAMSYASNAQLEDLPAAIDELKAKLAESARLVRLGR